MSWLLPLIVVAVLVGVAAWFGRRYVALRGPRLVECPESQQAAAVAVNAARAAAGGPFSLSACSRWPEKQSCGRECLAQIERSPEGCLVRTIVTNWYQDKRCAVCNKPVGDIDWYDRKPALMDEAGIARPWPEVQAERLPEVLATQRPVCFDCYVAETFRREHPDLVVDNPWKASSRTNPLPPPSI
ncbi:MAG TPA: hypothetical protein VGK32_14835 [Vicinamibacterales bacterium]|jgi:hypothetical protein